MMEIIILPTADGCLKLLIERIDAKSGMIGLKESERKSNYTAQFIVSKTFY